MARSSFYSTNPTTVEQVLGAEFLNGGNDGDIWFQV